MPKAETRIATAAVLLLALCACNRTPPPEDAAAPAAEKTEAAVAPAANPTARLPAAPIADDTSDDRASFQAKSAMPAMVTVLATRDGGPAKALQDGAQVTAKFAAGKQLACVVRLGSPLAPGNGGEAGLSCDAPLDLSDGAFDFTLHQGGRRIADGVVLR